MAKVRNVNKSLASMEDLLQGKGAVTQTRNKQEFDVHRIDVPFAVDTEAEMQALDVTRFTRARVYYDTTAFVDYIYDADATSGISPTEGSGYWVPKQEQVIATGTTTPRSLADWFADEIVVESFGAIGDGVTNDTSAFNLIRALGKTPRTLSGKTYLVDYSNPVDFMNVSGQGTITNGYINIQVDQLIGGLGLEDKTVPETGPIIRRQYASTEDLLLYVDASYLAASDGSASKPFKSINEALSFVPRNIFHKIRIYLYDGNYTGLENIFNLYHLSVTPRSSAGLKILGHTDSNPLYNDIDSSKVVIGNESTSLDGVSNFVLGGVVCDPEDTYIEGVTFDGRVQNYSRFGFKECTFKTGISGTSADPVLLDGHGGTSYLVNCDFQDCLRSVYAQDMANVFLEGCTGSNIGNSVQAARGSYINVRFSDDFIDNAASPPLCDDTSEVRVNGQYIRPDLFTVGTGRDETWLSIPSKTITGLRGFSGGKFVESSPTEPDRFVIYMDNDGNLNVRLNSAGVNKTVRLATF